MKYNERAWAGQLISWIEIAISEGRTIFEGATNDMGIKLASGVTKFPDILLFSDKTSGLIFNGWELKYPDTAVDDQIMLINALEKAERLRSGSFVTWNGREAIIWKINSDNYKVDSLTIVKHYPPDPNINLREDLSDPVKFRNNEAKLRKRLDEILHDLGQLSESGELKPAINVSGSFIEAVRNASEIILPQFKSEIIQKKGSSKNFRDEFNAWKIYERATLQILASSSRRKEEVIEEEVLAKFTFYNLIGRVLFYLTLAENLEGKLEKLDIISADGIKEKLKSYFELASKIDYQAVFKPYFTDIIEFNEVTNQAFFALISRFSEFDFKILPPNVIGYILENLVPKQEKQKFGQYFTPEILSNLVAFPAVQTRKSFLFDPTSGAGTFLNSFYKILKYHGAKDHGQILEQIWGNDISHFPAILSVISLYKQDVQTINNFPRVTREDFFSLEPGQKVMFPDPEVSGQLIEEPIPLFDGIASNFPFIQQEDIPNDILTPFFREIFLLGQRAFLKDNSFRINERSDYFAYCVYNAWRFLKVDGILSVITSNAWLGKEYGVQFKRFLLDNFHIKYVVRSSAEHWFTDSKVSTIYVVLEKGILKKPTKFITVNFKLNDLLSPQDEEIQLSRIEDFYTEVDHCDSKFNKNWTEDVAYNGVFLKLDGSIKVSIISNTSLYSSLSDSSNWATFFTAQNLFGPFEKSLAKLYPDVINSFRGQKTAWNPMFIIKNDEVENTKIEKQFLKPFIKGPKDFDSIKFGGKFNNYVFSCELPIEEIKKNYPGAYQWIKKFENEPNSNGSKTISQATGNRPYWYTIKPKQAHIVTAINPYQRIFFAYSTEGFLVDQRVTPINVKPNNLEIDTELVAALLNSSLNILIMEMRGTGRSLGALDLNADYFKELKLLDPRLLSTEGKMRIKDAFQPLLERKIKNVVDELKMPDRRIFDLAVLNAFSIDQSVLDSIYEHLSVAIIERITMKEK
ncbi:N-6 DNA methylase [Mucilaginibacter sp. PPCGB 2223]|uniref:N-6 DNA methylase n=1 Tax=Mucilaginibacter sp. PPCGB 2223 TaxID=1886027 RepID=UPI000826A73A|nr:N-6 DNA methylase [Mucilaginibacter sp. PPCGB 2223]OCX54181.1 N-6 DNA methylase [Mucilaginibacter sp. PPCGB 2223]